MHVVSPAYFAVTNLFVMVLFFSIGNTFFIYWITDLLAENPVGGAEKNKNEIGKNLSDDHFIEKPKNFPFLVI